MRPLLELEGLTKSFSRMDRPAVDDVSLLLAEGEVLGLVGESGSGKTTLLRIIAGLEIPADGRITLEGRTLFDRNTIVAPEQRNIGLVFQDYALFPHLTVRQNIEFGIHRLSLSHRRERVREMLQLTRMETLEKRHPHQLSGGEQQRVALARALAPRPRLLLLDEPFSNLDASLKALVRQDLHRILGEAGISAICVTHDVEDALAIADTIAVLQQGRLAQVGTPRQLYSEPGTGYVAAIFGAVNLLEGEAAPGGVESQIGFITCLHQHRPGLPVLLAIDAGGIRCSRVAGHHALRCVVTRSAFMGSYHLLLVSSNSGVADAGRIDLRIHSREAFDAGEEIAVHIPPEHVRVIAGHNHNRQERTDGSGD